MAGKCSTFMYLFLCTSPMLTIGSFRGRSIKTKVQDLKAGVLQFSAIFFTWKAWWYKFFKNSLPPCLKWGGREFFRMKKYWKLAEIKFAEVLRRPRRVLTRKQHKDWGADVILTCHPLVNSIRLHVLHKILCKYQLSLIFARCHNRHSPWPWPSCAITDPWG
jgi:hypothetical protein